MASVRAGPPNATSGAVNASQAGPERQGTLSSVPTAEPCPDGSTDVGTLPRAEAVALCRYPVVTQGAQHALIREGVKVQFQPSGAAVSVLSQKRSPEAPSAENPHGLLPFEAARCMFPVSRESKWKYRLTIHGADDSERSTLCRSRVAPGY